jgi:prepilin-type N-terminal cleavage/methylation domain-containing protein
MRQRGFTLVEIAIVVVIASLLLTMGLSWFVAFAKSQTFGAARKGEQTIKEALISYVSRNNRLPCPAVPTLPSTHADAGKEADPTQDCKDTIALGASRMGVVPWKALQLLPDSADDPWYRRYTYVVTLTATKPNSNPALQIRGSMSMANATMRPVATIVSHGPNGAGAYLPSGTRMDAPAAGSLEEENINADETFLAREEATDYDDFVLPLSADDILNPLIERGEIRSARAQTDDLLREWLDDLVNQTVALDGKAPLLPMTLPADAWGTPMNAELKKADVCGALGTDVAIKVVSGGEDLAINNQADQDATVKVSAIKSLLAKQGKLCP